MSVKVKFITESGDTVEVEGEPGDNLMRLAQAVGMPLEGTCECQMACATCHVVMSDDSFSKVPGASEEEEDMLDFAAGVRRTSRLSCQIDLTQDMDGLTVKVPS